MEGTGPGSGTRCPESVPQVWVLTTQSNSLSEPPSFIPAGSFSDSSEPGNCKRGDMQSRGSWSRLQAHSSPGRWVLGSEIRQQEDVIWEKL